MLWSGNPHLERPQEEISCKVNIVTKPKAIKDFCKWRERHDSSENYLAVTDNNTLNRFVLYKKQVLYRSDTLTMERSCVR